MGAAEGGGGRGDDARAPGVERGLFADAARERGGERGSPGRPDGPDDGESAAFTVDQADVSPPTCGRRGDRERV